MATKTLTKIYSPIEETHSVREGKGDILVKINLLTKVRSRFCWDCQIGGMATFPEGTLGKFFRRNDFSPFLLCWNWATGHTHTQSSRVVHWRDAGGDGDVDDGLTSGGTRHGTGRLNFYSKLYFFQALAITCTVFSCFSSAHDTNRQRFWHSL